MGIARTKPTSWQGERALSMVGGGKARSSFLKKEAKNFYAVASDCCHSSGLIDRSFLLLFFKKEDLPCLAFPR
jgi:hypothetical protein